MSREAERRATTLRSLNKASSGRDDPAFLQRRRPPYVCALCRPEARKVETGRRCFGGTRTRSDSDVRSPHPTAPVGAHARRSRVSSGPLRSRRSGSWPPPMGGLQGPPQSARTFAAPPVRSKAVAGHPRPISGRGGAICGSRRRPAAGASCCGRRRRLGQVKAAAAAHTTLTPHTLALLIPIKADILLRGCLVSYLGLTPTGGFRPRSMLGSPAISSYWPRSMLGSPAISSYWSLRIACDAVKPGGDLTRVGHRLDGGEAGAGEPLGVRLGRAARAGHGAEAEGRFRQAWSKHDTRQATRHHGTRRASTLVGLS